MKGNKNSTGTAAQLQAVAVETDKKYLYFAERQFFEASAGDNLCRIDARSGLLHFSRSLISLGGRKLPLQLSLVFDFQSRNITTINNRETGFPRGFRTNYHQTCIKQGDKFYYTDGGANLHVFGPVLNTESTWFDEQGTGLLLTIESSYIKIYDEFGNYSLFDGIGRLSIIHQKYTDQSSADLVITYSGSTERIVSIRDGMGRTTTFTYSTTYIRVAVNSAIKYQIIFSAANKLISSVVRQGNGSGEVDTYGVDAQGEIKMIKAASGATLNLEYEDDAVTEYYSNVQERKCEIEYNQDERKTVTKCNGVEEVITFNKEDILSGTYQLQPDDDGIVQSVNIYCVDQESCSAFSSVLATKVENFEFDKSIAFPQEGSATSNALSSAATTHTKPSIFFVKLLADLNVKSIGTITAKLLDESGDPLCTLEFNPSLEGLQIAAKPFFARRDGNNRFKVELNVKCTMGRFTFKEVAISPSLGKLEKLCTNSNIQEGEYYYTDNANDCVYFINGGAGTAFDNETIDESIALYTEDYLTNMRNAYKYRDSNGKFLFWYNKKHNCRLVQKAVVSYGTNAPKLTFDGAGVHSGNQTVNFYLLSYAPNGITTLTNENYNSNAFAADFTAYYLESNTIISDGAKAVKNTAYYDENLNVHAELQRSSLTALTQRTEHDVDSAGNVTRVSRVDAENSLQSIIDYYNYDDKDYLTSAYNFIQHKKSETFYGYDTLGNLRIRTAPNNFTQNYGYDTFGDRLIQLKAQIENQETINDIEYAKAQVSQMSEGVGAAYSFEYDDNSRLKSVKINENEYVEIVYNKYEYSHSDLITKTYTNGYKETNEYDQYGRLIYILQNTTQGNITLISYNYNRSEGAAGDLISIYDYTTSVHTDFGYNEYKQIIWIRKTEATYPGDDILLCDIAYNKFQLVESESYSYRGEALETVEYSYRSNLNYYAQVEKVVNTAAGQKLTVQRTWDNLNRVKRVSTLNASNQGIIVDIDYMSRTDYGTGTTPQISAWKYFRNTVSSDAICTDTFEYDVNGNIIRYNVAGNLTPPTGNPPDFSYEVRYEYDAASRLKVERNSKFDRTYVYSYDSNGNILSKSEYAYTMSDGDAPQKTYSYGYDSADPDRLLSWDGKAFAYDACGNPTRFKGEGMTWERGRLLKEYKGTTFYYDAEGERIGKYINGKSTDYYTINGKLIREFGAGREIIYLYDDSGIIGCVIDGDSFYYVKNAFGDVVALYSVKANGPVAKYVYDAWGNCRVCNASGVENTTATFVGNINPIRYRSYYWDSDVGLYYLHTRWYDPEIGRFVNLDQIEYLNPQTVNGLNLYAYCLNNPVMGTDPDGTAWWNPFTWDWGKIRDGFMTVRGALDPASYIAMGASVFNAAVHGRWGDVVEDWNNGSFNPFNQDIDAVAGSKVFSFYKGHAFIRQSFLGGSATIFGFTLLSDSVNGYYDIYHEYGHAVTGALLSPGAYIVNIAIPSLISAALDMQRYDYLSLPWERVADFLGGASYREGYKPNSLQWGWAGTFLGPVVFPFYFLFGFNAR